MPLALISGPPASGKTTRLLAPLRTALNARDFSVRLLVPSATMAEHFRNQLAREGLFLRRNTVSTLTRFVDSLHLSPPAPSAAQLEARIVELLTEKCPREYAELAAQPGFHHHLASCFDALSLAGVEPTQLDGPLASLYHRLLHSLQENQLALRGHRLRHITNGLSAAHLSGLSHLLLDGFFTFANTEQALLDRLAEFVPVTITQPTATPAAALRQPAIEAFAAADRAQEALLVCHRILDLFQQGVDLRRIGILLRNPASSAPLLETTLNRLGIPARSYLGTPLTRHPLTAFHRAFLQAAAAAWDNALLLKALRWRFTGYGGTPLGDKLEIEALSGLPSSSLDLFPDLAPFADWPTALFTPSDAATQLRRIATLLETPVNLSPDLPTAWLWRERASTLKQLHQLFDETAAALPALPLSLIDFWRHVETNLTGLNLHDRDNRTNVVHLMDFFEARQWELDYVFAPGLSDADFPQRFSPDPLLTESVKKNFGMKTLDDRQAEEHFLLDMLLTRARSGLCLSYPRTNEKGDPALPSPLLSFPFQPAPPLTLSTPAWSYQPPPRELGEAYRPPGPWSASELESYLSCPWKHFAARGLALTGLPESPAERLNPVVLGTVAHAAIRLWTLDPTHDIETLGERLLEAECHKKRISTGYHYERERINLLRNLRLYAGKAPPVPPGWQTFLEERFALDHPIGIAVRGQIDRYDKGPDGKIHAYDYKYSRSANLDEKYPIQGALYAQALGPQVSSFSFVALRDQAKLTTIEGSVLKDLIQLAETTMRTIVSNAESGHIAVDPQDQNNCQYCAFLDACRIRSASQSVEAEEATGAAE